MPARYSIGFGAGAGEGNPRLRSPGAIAKQTAPLMSRDSDQTNHCSLASCVSQHGLRNPYCGRLLQKGLQAVLDAALPSQEVQRGQPALQGGYGALRLHPFQAFSAFLFPY